MENVRRQPWRAAYDDDYAARSDLRGWDEFFWWLGFAAGLALVWFARCKRPAARAMADPREDWRAVWGP